VSRDPLGRNAPVGSPAWKRGAAALVLMLLALHGLLVDFVPAPWLQGVGMGVVCVAFGLIGTIALRRHGLAHGRIPEFRANLGHLKDMGAWVLMPFFFAFIFWSVLTRSLPWWWTASVGDVVERSVVMKLQHTQGRARGRCRERLYGGPLVVGFLCAPAGVEGMDSRQPLPVRLHGRFSSLGHEVWHVEIDHEALAAAAGND
jgi:hypothetical protein